LRTRFLTTRQRRRAQNRKAQKAFRERKDKAIQRLEEEVEKLNTLNQSLRTANEARLREISELKAELEERSSVSSSPRRNSCFEGWDSVTSKRGSVSSDRTSTSVATTPIVPDEAADVCGPFIKWRGRVYIDAESFLKRQPKECG
jgi:bZIP transcription factor